MWVQREIRLQSHPYGFHIIDKEVVDALPELSKVKIGLLHLFIKHTSAGLSLNENYDPDVRTDMAKAYSRLAPENAGYLHSDEGPDDMPAHIKSTLVGSSVTIPVRNGSLCTGTWQGIYLCEFRRSHHRRIVTATLQGESSD